MIADGYEFVESQAPEYDKTAGIAIYWRDLVDFVNLFDYIIQQRQYCRQSEEMLTNLMSLFQEEL